MKTDTTSLVTLLGDGKTLPVWCKFIPFRTHRDDPHRHRDDLAEDGLNPSFVA